MLAQSSGNHPDFSGWSHVEVVAKHQQQWESKSLEFLQEAANTGLNTQVALDLVIMRRLKLNTVPPYSG